MSGPTPLTALYVPGSRPDRFAKAAASGADVVILDLEDSVAPAAKGAARAAVVAWLAGDGLRKATTSVAVQVRVNAPATAWGADDLVALPPGVAVRLPKVESRADLDAAGDRDLHVVIESAAGIEQTFDIASHPRVVSLALGEADLSAELGVTDEAGLGWLRMRLVIAARAAGLPAPMMSVYPEIADLGGLAASCALGRGLGMRGRAAVHPSQLSVIIRAFAPTAQELAWAAAVVAAFDGSGGGVTVLPDGAMVDAAMVRRARELLGRDTV